MSHSQSQGRVRGSGCFFDQAFWLLRMASLWAAPTRLLSVLAGSVGGTPAHLSLSLPGSSAGGLSCCPGSFCLAPALSLGSGCAWGGWGGGSPGASPAPGGPLTLPENGTFVRAPAQGSGPGFLKAPDRTCLLQLRPGLTEMPCMASFLISCQPKGPPACWPEMALPQRLP